MRIGELAAACGLSTRTLRFYENRGLLPPAERRSNGYRAYGEAALARVDFIRRGRAAGLSLDQIREVLGIRESGNAPCHHVRNLLTERLDEIDRQISDLQALRANIAQLRESATQLDPAACRPGEVCRYL